MAFESVAPASGRGRHWALRDATFELREGEHWLLFGANGAGKTVLLKLLRGDLWPTPTRHAARHYHFADGQVQEQPLEARERIAYLGPERQDRYDRYESTLTVGQVVLTGFDDSDFPLQPPTTGQRRRSRRCCAASACLACSKGLSVPCPMASVAASCWPAPWYECRTCSCSTRH